MRTIGTRLEGKGLLSQVWGNCRKEGKVVEKASEY